MGALSRSKVRNLYAGIDALDVATVISFFAEDAHVVFGNGQPLVGINEIRTGTTAFFETIAGLHHEVVNEWNVGDDAIIEFKVTYDRKDGRQVTIPCVTILRTDATGKIADYRVYYDVAPVYA
jgi:ketosteroid isomerase-like protein